MSIPLAAIMRFSLFPHNQTAYDAAELLLRETGKAAIVHPTGTGKSFIGFKLCEMHADSRVCWLSPSSYIFDTQLENLRKASGGWTPENVAFFTYAKLMLLSDDALRQLRPDYIILDEFHRCGAEFWGTGVARLLEKYPQVPILGLSATAIRYLDNQRDMADELFDGNIASEITLGEAIVRGILQPPKYVLTAYSYQQDLERYERRVQNAPNPAVGDQAQRYLDALRRTLEMADGLDVIFARHMPSKRGKYLVFCANAEHMREMIALAPKWFLGVDARPHIYSAYSSDPESSKAFAAFKTDASDHLKLLYCIDMLNEGVHLDGVSGVILLRPTVSPTVFKQQIGRAMSVSQDAEVVVFDVVMNILNLYSIGAIQEEMEAAISYYRFLGEGGNIVNDQFRVIDELRDCRQLFEKLDDTLTASWDVMYALAARHYAQNGDLAVTDRYRTEEGYSLGAWLATQRQIRKGKTGGTLSDEQIQKLDAIGMRWESKLDAQWERYYSALAAYRDAHGDLDLPTDAVVDGLNLGRWLARLRAYRNAGVRTEYLTPERIVALDQLGMIWGRLDYYWERNYAAALQYYHEHGNLRVPRRYVTTDGIALGDWLQSIKRRYRESGGTSLTQSQRDRLIDLGLVLPAAVKPGEQKQPQSAQERWEQAYACAARYAAEHHDLKLTVNEQYEGLPLGRWLQQQKQAYRAGKLSAERAERLESLGIDWRDRRTVLWEEHYAQAREFYVQNGHLEASASSPLGVWLNRQRQKYVDGTLPESQMRRLDEIGMAWATEDGWETGYQAAARYYAAHGDLDIPAAYRTERGFALGRWCRTQRDLLRAGRLPETRRIQLEQIGFCAEPVKERSWMRSYALAKRFFEENGDLNIPGGYTAASGEKLGVWISTQRGAYRKGKLAEEQVALLEQIGMEWDRHESRWHAALERAQNYYERHGDLEIPASYAAQDGFALGAWLRQQREHYRRGKLSRERIEALEQLGVSWRADARLRRKATAHSIQQTR